MRRISGGVSARITEAKADRVGAVLVVGGGIGGVQASLDLAESGFKVYLAEAFSSIGGVMAQLDKTFPTNDCSMCILSPKLVECGRHLNIDILTNAEMLEVSGEAGNFTVLVKEAPRYVDIDKCTGCGLCAKLCPVGAVDVYNGGLTERNAIYIRYPQAVPLAYAIDERRCIGCGLCENICLAEAVEYGDIEKTTALNVGAIILMPGCEEFDAHVKSEYGYDRYPNVVTSLEFERILSASGPYSGRVQRPSDGDIPRKIAFIQCVGSRDRICGNDYCSSVCCMYATKESIIAKEHMSQINVTIFYVDMRAHGKDFDKYVERAKKDYGVRYVRFRVSEVEEVPKNHNLKIKYESEDGALNEEEFDLVVLSIGLQPSEAAQRLAQKLGVELNEYGFCKTKLFSPLETSKPGIFVGGTFSLPKDIPDTVTQASGAACLAECLLSPARGSLVKEKTYPEELDVAGQPPRIGVFICHCGINIGAVVEVPRVVEYSKHLPNVVYAEENLYTCSQDTQELIKQKIKEHKLNRVVVASCTPRTHEPLFQETIKEAGLNPYLFEMANIRDQCSWVHTHEPKAATEKSKDLIRMAVAKTRRLIPLKRRRLEITPIGLVIGGGLSGMTAALGLAEQGFEAYLVEKKKELGGILRKTYYTVEGDDVQEHLTEVIDKVRSNQLIHVLTDAKIEEISGYVGNFQTIVRLRNKEEKALKHGVIIVATGGEMYEPIEHLYGRHPRVITQQELESKIAKGYNIANHRNVVMIQCVGSRKSDRPYCSRVCCSEAIKNALKIKELNPSTDVFILFRDMRTYGFREDYYSEARDAGVLFIRYGEDREPIVTPRGKDENGSLIVSVYEPTLGEELSINADVVVLSTAITPPFDNMALAQMLKVPLNEDRFFLEAHAKLRPIDFATKGIFTCGLAHAPKFIDESISQAYAAASRACTLLTKEKIDSEGTIATVDEERCTGCGVCVEVCPYKAVVIDESQKVAKVNDALCEGCGACSASCRCNAIDLYGSTDEQILSILNAL